MQHIFNIAIDLDDDVIRDAIAENAEKAITQKILGDVEDAIFNHAGCSRQAKTDPTKRMGTIGYI